MCGIAGYFGGKAFDAAAMLRELHHRGPDGRSIWQTSCGNRTLHLVHTRLSIIDPTEAASQPMLYHSADRTVTHSRALPRDFNAHTLEMMPGGCASGKACDLALIYNGEIYNYLELREELVALGHKCNSTGDTEVLLRGYAVWGKDLFRRLDGMFALAIYDRARNELIFARDHIGIKPLYYSVTMEGGLVFASQLRAIQASNLVNRAVSLDSVHDYLRFGSVQEPYTLLEKVHAFPPGHYAVIRLDEIVAPTVQTQPYWLAEHILAAPALTPASWFEAHRSLFSATATEQLTADVPVGVFLSGGLDSSVILEALSSEDRRNLTAFTVSGPMTTTDEGTLATMTARNLGVRHKQVYLSDVELHDWLGDALDAMDQPTCDGVNIYLVSRASRLADIKVALAGIGADELHGAYGHAVHLGQLIRNSSWLGGLGGVFGQTLAAAYGILRDPVLGERLRIMLRASPVAWRVAQEKRRFFTPRQIEAFWPEIIERPERWIPPFRDASASVGIDLFNLITLSELRGYLTNTLLRDSDWASMANNLELRVPFLGRKYIEFALKAPADLRSPMGQTPKPLVTAIISQSNRHLLGVPKSGFHLDYLMFLLGPLREEFGHSIRALQSMGFQRSAADILSELSQSGSAKLARRYWALFALGYWLNKHVG